MKNGNGKPQKNQLDSFAFPLVPTRRKPTEEQVVGFVKEANRRIDEAGATLAQLYWMLGRALLHLQDLPRYGSHGKWEQWLRRWQISQSRWMRAKRLAETYSTPEQLQQVPVDRALKVGARGRKRTRRELVVSAESNGQTYTPADGITMRCCDFRKLRVERSSAKAVITDPPWAASWTESLPALAEFCARVLRPDGAAIFFYGVQSLPTFIEAMCRHLDYQWMLCGPYQRPGLLQRRVQFVSNYQVALVFGKSRFALPKPVGDLLPDDGTKSKTMHPWARNPLAVRYCVESFTSPDDLVLDPLAGSFTCAEACHELGRRYIGCDADPAAIELAKRRFNDAQARLYDELTEEAG
jgi:predicted RNA methylase